jgi:hypothetical protein
VDMWTTQERCPHAHSDNNRRKQLIKLIKLKSPTRLHDEANFFPVEKFGHGFL